MGEMKHLVVAKFKEGVDVQHIVKGMEELVSSLHYVSSFEWGEDLKSEEMLRQGFTHAFIMTFNTQQDLTAFVEHPKHIEFSVVFSTAIANVLVLDFPALLLKPEPKSEAEPEVEAAADDNPPPPADPPAADA